METNYSFKSIEVTGTTKEEAFANTPFTAPVTLWTNATQKWQNFLKKNPTPTEAEIKQFKLDYIKEKKIAPGQAAYIVKEASVADSRERPYRVENIKNEGTRHFKAVHVAYDKRTGNKIATLSAKKADALNEVKKMYQDKVNPLRTDVQIVKEQICDKGSAVVAEVYYSPSKNFKVGTYCVFGLVSHD